MNKKTARSFPKISPATKSQVPSPSGPLLSSSLPASSLTSTLVSHDDQTVDKDEMPSPLLSSSLSSSASIPTSKAVVEIDEGAGDGSDDSDDRGTNPPLPSGAKVDADNSDRADRKEDASSEASDDTHEHQQNNDDDDDDDDDNNCNDSNDGNDNDNDNDNDNNDNDNDNNDGSNNNERDVEAAEVTNATPATPNTATPTPPATDARRTWMMINLKFQLILLIVALFLSVLLLVSIMAWVIMTIMYFYYLSTDCDLELKRYYWTVTALFFLHFFRNDIFKVVFCYDRESNTPIPVRIIIYNIVFVAFAVYVFQLGVSSTFVFPIEKPKCPSAAAGLFITTRVFVCITLAGFTTVIFGCFIPFIIVTFLLTRNGYSPSIDDRNGGIFEQYGVFPSRQRGAPADFINRLRTVEFADFLDSYERECCICIAAFSDGDTIVATECEHVFHKQCCEEWLRNARTCPICRADMVSALEPNPNNDDDGGEGGTAGAGAGAAAGDRVDGPSRTSSRPSRFMEFPFNFSEMRGMIDNR